MPRAVIDIEYEDGRVRLSAHHPDRDIESSTFIDLPVDNHDLAQAMDWLAKEIDDLVGRPFGAWTSTQIGRYVNSGGSSCPHCGSAALQRDNASGNDLRQDPEVPFVRVAVQCLDCRRTWIDLYKLTNVHPIYKKDGK